MVFFSEAREGREDRSTAPRGNTTPKLTVESPPFILDSPTLAPRLPHPRLQIGEATTLSTNAFPPREGVGVMEANKGMQAWDDLLAKQG